MPLSTHKNNLASTAFTCTILLATFFITQRYILPIASASVIAISTWPFYLRWLKLCRGRHNWAAGSLTLLLLLIIIIPVTWFLVLIAKEAQHTGHFILAQNKTGIPTPTWIDHIPLVGKKLSALWQNHLSHPQFIQHITPLFNQHYKTLGNFIQLISAKTIHHSIGFFFSMLTLFFLYRDGTRINNAIDQAGNNIFPHQWNHYFTNIASAIRGVVNGTVLTGFGVGISMSICYYFASVPFPALFGLITAFFAMIPFGIAIILLVVVTILIVQGSYWTAFVTLIAGGIVNFISDHIIKPKMISNAIQLPFLMILIGIIGGMENLGIIGLFLGPIIMVLCYKLFLEYSQELT